MRMFLLNLICVTVFGFEVVTDILKNHTWLRHAVWLTAHLIALVVVGGALMSCASNYDQIKDRAQEANAPALRDTEMFLKRHVHPVDVDHFEDKYGHNKNFILRVYRLFNAWDTDRLEQYVTDEDIWECQFEQLVREEGDKELTIEDGERLSALVDFYMEMANVIITSRRL